VLTLKQPHAKLHGLYQGPTRVALLDADAELHTPVVELLTGIAPDDATRVRRVPARDAVDASGAPVARRFLMPLRVSRTALRDGAVWRWELYADVLRRVAAFARGRGVTACGLVTYHEPALVLEALLGRSTEKYLEAFPEADDRRLAEDGLRPFLAAWPTGVDLHVGYFGALRGLNHWKHLDLLATVGDPRPNVVDADRAAAYVGPRKDGTPFVSEHHHEVIARAELRQAHGRLRTPRRASMCMSLHVGALVPFGTGWEAENVTIVTDGDMDNSRNLRAIAGLHAALGALGSHAAVCGALGVDPFTLKRWVLGAVDVPIATFDALLQRGWI
jgi:hypothetical protein